MLWELRMKMKKKKNNHHKECIRTYGTANEALYLQATLKQLKLKCRELGWNYKSNQQSRAKRKKN